jgi:hypothetical protein
MSKWKPQKIRPLGGNGRRRNGKGLDLEIFPGPALGPGVVTADYGTVLAALEGFDPEMPWKKVRARVLPMLPRVRPMPGPELELARAMLPPGILVGFGIDIGPAITFVGASLLDRWRVDVLTVVAASLANLRRLALECDRDAVIRDRIGDVPVTLIQTRLGIAASLILVPECLDRLIGPGPHLLLAPMRDILIALPPDVDREFAAWLADEWEALDPNHLHLGGFRYERGTIVPEALDEALARA